MIEVDVWQAPLVGVEMDDCLDELSPEEQARAAAIRVELPRRRFVVAHAALRRILTDYVGREVCIAVAPNGKPYLPGHEIRFNLSHSADLALVAVTRGCEVGVDVERIRPVARLEKLAALVLPPGERPCEEAAFFRAWVRKEAYVKGTGRGLRDLRLPISPGWTVIDLDVSPGYAAAVAVQSDHCRVRMRRAAWPPSAVLP